MTPTDAPNSVIKVHRGFFGRSVAWLFSPKHFHFKLLSGTAVGIVVITFLAGLFLFVTLRNHHQESLRAHTLEVLRLASVIENDIAVLETGHRGFLLTGDNFLRGAIRAASRIAQTPGGRSNGLDPGQSPPAEACNENTGDRAEVA